MRKIFLQNIYQAFNVFIFLDNSQTDSSAIREDVMSTGKYTPAYRRSLLILSLGFEYSNKNVFWSTQALKVMPEISSETSVTIYHVTRRNIAKYLILNQNSATNSRHIKI